jgi:acetolactate synthase-1/2/3 large subunit
MADATDGFAPALECALAYIDANSLPVLIELRYDANLITPNITIAGIDEGTIPKPVNVRADFSA